MVPTALAIRHISGLNMWEKARGHGGPVTTKLATAANNYFPFQVCLDYDGGNEKTRAIPYAFFFSSFASVDVVSLDARAPEGS